MPPVLRWIDKICFCTRPKNKVLYFYRFNINECCKNKKKSIHFDSSRLAWSHVVQILLVVFLIKKDQMVNGWNPIAVILTVSLLLTLFLYGRDFTVCSIVLISFLETNKINARAYLFTFIISHMSTYSARIWNIAVRTTLSMRKKNINKHCELVCRVTRGHTRSPNRRDIQDGLSTVYYFFVQTFRE